MPSAGALRFRRFGARDRAFVAALAREAFAEFAREPVGSTLSLVQRHTSLIAERDGTPVGFATLRLGRGEAELLAIAVVPHERGRGVGRALVRLAESTAREASARSLSLHTADANLAALSTFLRSGFRVERRLPRYYRGVFDACELRKTL